MNGHPEVRISNVDHVGGLLVIPRKLVLPGLVEAWLELESDLGNLRPHTVDFCFDPKRGSMSHSPDWWVLKHGKV